MNTLGHLGLILESEDLQGHCVRRLAAFWDLRAPYFESKLTVHRHSPGGRGAVMPFDAPGVGVLT